MDIITVAMEKTAPPPSLLLLALGHFPHQIGNDPERLRHGWKPLWQANIGVEDAGFYLFTGAAFGLRHGDGLLRFAIVRVRAGAIETNHGASSCRAPITLPTALRCRARY
jgi:hypothetical protein